MSAIGRIPSPLSQANETSRIALLAELTRIQAELCKRLTLCAELRERRYAEPEYAEMLEVFREEIPTPHLDALFKTENVPLREDVLLDCIVSHLRLRRLCADRPQPGLLLQHEVLLTLAYTAARKAYKRLLDE